MRVRFVRCVMLCGFALMSACASSVDSDGEIAESHEALSSVRAIRPPLGPEKPEPKVVTCGGFLGTECPGVAECVDDPRDECDPANGGADCGGICRCTNPVSCPKGTSFNNSAAVCDCQPVKLGPLDDRCAVTTCPANTKCRIIEGEVACVPTGIVLQ